MNSYESPADIANQLFHESPYHEIRLLTCTFEDGVLTIGGRLPTFHMKQIAQTVVRDIDGVEQVQNQTEVEA